ncbi:MAG: response regulator [Chitinophagaceae bacterium]|nr:response regulator [Oligoflexus sp.]
MGDPTLPGLMTDGQATRVLVAEDSPINRKMLAYQLSSLNLSFDCVEDGRQALAAAKKSSYALILMDCHMPDIDGYEAAQIIRLEPDLTLRCIPIVGVSSLSLNNDLARCLDSGMNDCLSKPVRLEDLYLCLIKWLPLALIRKPQPQL